MQAEAQLGLGMSLLYGFIITGGGKLTIELSVSIDLGPVSIQALQLTLQPAADQFQLGAGVNLTANLGPLAASVEGIGIKPPCNSSMAILDRHNLMFPSCRPRALVSR